jgi:hypothetical protein
MVVKIMALVDPQGNVVNKIVVDMSKPFTLPPGWSMHEWTAEDEAAYESYLQSLKGGGANG